MEYLIPTKQEPQWRMQDYQWDAHRLVISCNGEDGLQEQGTMQGFELPDAAKPLTGPSMSLKPTSCQVDGCNRCLLEEKQYQRRHGTCEAHMRAASVMVQGTSSRFCQQCGRFEPLTAFDGDRRSCRARLQQHNKRRRNVGGNSSKKGCRRRGRSHPSNSPPTTSQEEAAAAAAASGLAAILPDEPAVGILEGWAGSAASSETGRLLQEQDAALEGFVERLDASAGAMSIDDPSQLAASGASGTASAAGGGQAYDLPSSCLFEELAASDAAITWASGAACQEEEQMQLPAGAPQLPGTAAFAPGSTSRLVAPSTMPLPTQQQQQPVTGLRTFGRLPPGAAYSSLTLEVPDEGPDVVEVHAALGQQSSPAQLVIGTSPSLLDAPSSMFGSTATDLAPSSRASQPQQQQQQEGVLEQDFAGRVGGLGAPVQELAALLTAEQWAEMEEAVEAQVQQVPPTAAEKLRQLGLPSLMALRDGLQVAVDQQRQQQQQQTGPVEPNPAAVHTKTLLDVATVLVSYRTLRAAAQQQPHPAALVSHPGGWQYPTVGISGCGLSMSAVSSWAAAAAREQGVLTPNAPLYGPADSTEAPHLVPGAAAGGAATLGRVQHALAGDGFGAGRGISQPCGSDLYGSGQPGQQDQACGHTSAAPSNGLDNRLDPSLTTAGSTAAAAAAGSSCGAIGGAGAAAGLWHASDQLAAASSVLPGLRAEQDAPAFSWQQPHSAILPGNQQHPQHADAWGLDRQYGSDDMLLPSAVFMPCSAAAACPADAAAGIYPRASSSGWDNLSSLDVAARLAPGSGAGISYEPQDASLRLAVKLHSTTPDQLPGDLQQRLSSMLPETMGVEAGYIRPGCVQLVLQLRARLDASGQRDLAEQMEAAKQQLQARCTWDAAMGLIGPQLQLTCPKVVVQHPGQLLAGEHGSLRHTVPLQPAGTAAAVNSGTGSSSSSSQVGSGRKLPELKSVMPPCLTSGSSMMLLAVGHHLHDCQLFIRCQGSFLQPKSAVLLFGGHNLQLQMGPHGALSTPPAAVLRQHDADGADGEQQLLLALQEATPHGLLWVEVQQGGVLSEAQPVLLLDDEDVAAELATLATEMQCSRLLQQQLAAKHALIDFGRLLDFQLFVERKVCSSCSVSSTSQLLVEPSWALADPLEHASVFAVAAASSNLASTSSTLGADLAPAGCNQRSGSMSDGTGGGRSRMPGGSHGPDSTGGSGDLRSVHRVMREPQRQLQKLGRQLPACLAPASIAVVPTLAAAAGLTPIPESVSQSGECAVTAHSNVVDGGSRGQAVGTNGAGPSSAAEAAAGGSMDHTSSWEDALASDLVAELALAEAADRQVVQELLHWALTAGSGMPAAPAVRLLAGDAAVGVEQPQRSPQLVPASAAGAAPVDVGDDIDDGSSSNGSSSSGGSSGGSSAAAGGTATENAAGGASRHPLMTADHVALIMETGCRLLVFCVRRGWSHAAERVLRVLLNSAGAPYPSVVAHATAQAGVSLLHLAVQSGQPSMVSALLRSGRAHFFTWPWNIPGPVGTTPLHVAALAAGPDIALLALQTSPEASQDWFFCRTHDGHTPADFAARRGHHHLMVLALQRLALSSPSAADAVVAGQPWLFAAGNSCSSTSWGPTPPSPVHSCAGSSAVSLCSHPISSSTSAGYSSSGRSTASSMVSGMSTAASWRASRDPVQRLAHLVNMGQGWRDMGAISPGSRLPGSPGQRHSSRGRRSCDSAGSAAAAGDLEPDAVTVLAAAADAPAVTRAAELSATLQQEAHAVLSEQLLSTSPRAELVEQGTETGAVLASAGQDAAQSSSCRVGGAATAPLPCVADAGATVDIEPACRLQQPGVASSPLLTPAWSGRAVLLVLLLSLGLVLLVLKWLHVVSPATLLLTTAAMVVSGLAVDFFCSGSRL